AVKHLACFGEAIVYTRRLADCRFSLWDKKLDEIGA
ncbi:hypothetical protein CSUI_005440, partial [Cystoisospora suis]